MKRATSVLVWITLVISMFTPTANVQPVSSEDVMVSSEFPTDMPCVYIDPPNVTAFHCDVKNFTINVKVFNLTNNFYSSGEPWELGEPLPPAGILYNYSLGNLYGIDIRLEWDPTILNYSSHQVTIPVDTYPEGVLFDPAVLLREEVNATEGTCWVASKSMAPAPVFNAPDANTTFFNVTFTVKRPGSCTINITHSALGIASFIAKPEFEGVQPEIPHHVQGAQLNLYWNPADINNNLEVCFHDFVTLCFSYGSTPSDPCWNCQCDIAEPRGVIDFYDMVTMAANFGREHSPCS